MRYLQCNYCRETFIEEDGEVITECPYCLGSDISQLTTEEYDKITEAW